MARTQEPSTQGGEIKPEIKRTSSSSLTKTVQSNYTFLQDCGDLVRSFSICIDLHPDECTEDILDVARQYGKPVAIVPCCVLAGFLPIRTLRCGTAVWSYEQLMQYLLEKNDWLRVETLPFEGKNRVIYYTERITLPQLLFLFSVPRTIVKGDNRIHTRSS